MSKPWSKLKRVIKKIPIYLQREIWHASTLNERSVKGRLFALLRLFSIIFEGLKHNRIPSQAAALSYYTLIALGPLIAIAIMISGFVIKPEQQELTVKALTELVYFVAPSAETASELESELDTPSGKPAELPEIVHFIENVVNNARSGTVGVIGSLILIVICIQLLSTIEKTFNSIWGARQSRSPLHRLMFYWLLLTLGGIVGFASLSLGIYQRASSVFENLPNTGIFEGNLEWVGPAVTFLVITLLIAVFNRTIPNTAVRWGPSFFGAIVVTLLLFLNKNLTFLYVSQVIRQQSLFGSVGILPVLLFGLFVFWLFLLLGGQITYSAQNVNTLSNRRVWDNVSLRARESLCFAGFILIARSFQNCQPPVNAHQLALQLRAPDHIINSSLIRLCDMGLIRPIESRDRADRRESYYQPAMPLDKINLADFKEKFEFFGTNENLELYRGLDPLLEKYQACLNAFKTVERADMSIADWFKDLPVKI